VPAKRFQIEHRPKGGRHGSDASRRSNVGWIGAAIFVVLVASAILIAFNRDDAQEVAALDQVRAPPISQPNGN